MIKGSSASGYTIVEVMIFLAVSSVLLVSTIAMISGQQGRTEFSTAMNDIESRIKDVDNDVVSGFYPNTSNFSCTANGSGPFIRTPGGGGAQGTNFGCTYIGRVMQFSVADTNGNGYNVYTVAGQRLTGSAGSPEVTSLSQALPVAIAIDSNNHSTVDALEANTLQNGLKVAKMTYTNNGTTTPISAVGFFSTFNTYSGTNLVSGAQAISLIPIPATSPEMTSQALADAVDAADGFAAGAYVTNPSGGVTICFESSGSSQYGQITIGSDGRQLSTTRTIGSGSCP